MLDAHRDEAIDAVRRWVRDPGEAEDCVHDAIVRLAQRTDLDPDRVRSLLVRAAVHIAIDRRRAREREARAAERLAAKPAPAMISPEQVVADRADVERVLAAVETLPERERQVMRLRLSGVSVAETARLLGVTYKSIEGTYTRARARVRLLLGTMLAWLAARLRRSHTQQSSEVLAAAAAMVVLLVTPLWRSHGAPRGPAAATSPAAFATEHGLRQPPLPGAPPPAEHLRATAGGSDGDRAGSDGRGAGGGAKSDHVIFYAPIYAPGGGGPGHVTVTGDPNNVDPVDGVEKCLQQGGPTETIVITPSAISVNGGCDT